MACFGQFKFGMSDALIEQIIQYLDELEWAPLTQENVDANIVGAARQSLGVYLLGRTAAPDEIRATYVGQSQSAIYDRLTKHARFVRDRRGLPLAQLHFKAAEIIIFDSVHVETRLIHHFATKWVDADPQCGWNGSGFGSNDTGGGRDDQKPSKFDKRFPIDITLVKEGLLDPGPVPVRDAIKRMREVVPYTIRVLPKYKRHEDLNTVVAVTDTSSSVLSAVRTLLGAMPPGWTARAYPVRIVLERDAQRLTPVAEAERWPPNFAEHDYAVVTPQP